MSGARNRLRMFARNAPTRLWFLPSILTAAAVGLAILLEWVDATVSVDPHSRWWLFGGTADGARTVLQVVAGSLISVIAIAFSLTIIAFQQAATQYTPRVLRNFSRDRGNQIVLGTYIATFVFSLLVLREVRSETTKVDQFIPVWSMLADGVLVLASLGMLIYFIHHVTESIQASRLLDVVSSAARTQVDRLFPDVLARGASDPEPYEQLVAQLTRDRGEPTCCVTFATEGYVQEIDEDQLLAACGGADLAILEVGVGDFVAEGTLAIRVWGERPLPPRLAERARDAILIDRTRSIDQDVGFALQQLVDIALKALSPAINDPATAEQALDRIGAVLGRLAERRDPEPIRASATTRLLFRRESFDDLAEVMLRQVRYAARTNLRVTMRLLHVLAEIAARAASVERRRGLGSQAHAVIEDLPASGFTGSDIAGVRGAVDAVLADAHSSSASANAVQPSSAAIRRASPTA